MAIECDREDETGRRNDQEVSAPPATRVPPREHENESSEVPRAGTDAHHEGGGRHQKGLLRLSIVEWVTLAVSVSTAVIGAASLAVSYQAYRVAADSNDIKVAIKNLAKLADQTKRQADNSGEQIAILRAQAADTRKQTNAIADQTKAIVGSTNATSLAAGAQRTAAIANVRSQSPRLTLSELTFTGFKSEPNKEGLVDLSLRWILRNAGGAMTVKRSGFQTSIGRKLPEPMILPKESPGNDLVITSNITSALTITEPVKTSFPHAYVVAVNEGRLNAYFYGFVDYEDVLGTPHRQCFGFVLTIKEGQSVYFRPDGGPSYHCAT